MGRQKWPFALSIAAGGVILLIIAEVLFSCTFSAHRQACFSMKASATHNRRSSRGQVNESGSSIRWAPASLNSSN